MASESKKTLEQRLADQLERFPSLEKLLLLRNLGMGAALASFVLMLELVGVEKLSLPLEVSLVACAIAIPLWVAMAGAVEYYIVLGPKSYAHKRTTFARRCMGALAALGGLALVVALAAVFYHLEPLAAYVFSAATGCGLIVVSLFQWHLAHWYFARREDHAEQESGT